jgi:hypothetical protein
LKKDKAQERKDLTQRTQRPEHREHRAQLKVDSRRKTKLKKEGLNTENTETGTQRTQRKKDT